MTTEHDPCPGCRPNVVCRTPKCGRLKLQAQQKLLASGKSPTQEMIDWDAAPKYCCHRCFAKTGGFLDRMLLCPECGNKRCPKATDHELACTDSNEPGQLGSIYGGLHVEPADDPDMPQSKLGEAW